MVMSARMTGPASGSHWGILTGQFQWWQQWQCRNVLPLKQNVCSTVGYPDSWYVTLWLTWNHKSSDPFPFLCNFPSSSICFSFAETKVFTLLFLWKHGIPEGFVGSINHENGSIVITSTLRIRPALQKENIGYQSYCTGDNVQLCRVQAEILICNRIESICAATVCPALLIHGPDRWLRAMQYPRMKHGSLVIVNVHL